MDKKILIGSIIAIAILVVASLTSVVGYKSIGYGVKASPLFNIRSSRAIDEEQDIEICNYLGKDKHIDILLPIRNEKTILIYKMLDVINKIDDDTFKKLMSLVIFSMSKEHNIDVTNKVNYQDIFYAVRSNPLELQQFAINNDEILLPFEFTHWQHHTICAWRPGCILELVTGLIELLLIPLILLYIFITGKTFCGPCGPHPDTCTLKSKLNIS